MLAMTSGFSAGDFKEADWEVKDLIEPPVECISW